MKELLAVFIVLLLLTATVYTGLMSVEAGNLFGGIFLVCLTCGLYLLLWSVIDETFKLLKKEKEDVDS